MRKTEVTRSFSYKLGQPNYSSVDFFCSITEECFAEEEVKETSERLYQFCKSEVQKSMAEFLEGVEAKKKASEESDKEKVVKRGRKAEKKDNAKQGAELDAGQETVEELTIEKI